jgi:hypothetical protein
MSWVPYGEGRETTEHSSYIQACRIMTREVEAEAKIGCSSDVMGDWSGRFLILWLGMQKGEFCSGELDGILVRCIRYRRKVTCWWKCG